MDIISYLQLTNNINFNQQQIQAINSTDTHTLLLAVPGSGKTTVLVTRIANLIMNNKVATSKILTLTFSRETAKDMSVRFTKLFPQLTAPKFSTIHSFCFTVMRFYATVYKRDMLNIDNFKLSTIFKSIVLKHSNEYISDDRLETIKNEVSFIINSMVDVKKYESVAHDNFYEIYTEYKLFKKENKVIDYDDMLDITYDIFDKCPKVLQHFKNMYQYINIDEAQDTSLLQHKIIQLFNDSSVIFMVGDEDQSIYTFRGACPKALLDFKNDYHNSAILKLETNYRSGTKIVYLADQFIKMNSSRFPKNMIANNSFEGEINEITLADFNKQSNQIIKLIEKLEGTTAVLYRLKSSSVPLIELLNHNNIDFYIKDSPDTFYNSVVVKDLHAYVELSIDLTSTYAFSQLYYKLGFSRVHYRYVEDNINRFDCVFSCLASLNNLRESQISKALYLGRQFKLLSKKSAVDALNFIKNQLCYEDYLYSGMVSVSTLPIHLNNFSIATQLAQKCSTLTELFYLISKQPQSLENNFIPNNQSVTLSTIHSSKGLEFDNVIILDCLQGILPTNESIADKIVLEDEVRLFYVAVTRAKKHIYFFTSKKSDNHIISISSFQKKYLGGLQNDKK